MSVRFSARLQAAGGALEENALSRAAEARRRSGAPLLDLTLSDPTRAGLPLDAGAVLRALVHPGALVHEPDPRGWPAARAAVARYLAEARGARVPPERIFLTASTSEAYAWVFKLLCDPGDAVLVPAPGYPLFGWLTALEGVRAVPVPWRFDGEWHLEASALDEALAGEPRARAVLAVNPMNPTGAYLKRDERALLADRCRARGLALVADEVFADFALGPDPRRVEGCAAFDDVLSFSLSGLSKVCGLPQLKLGWCAVAGPPAEVAEACARLELVADTYLSPGAPVQRAAPELLEGRHAFQRALLARLRHNRAALAVARPAGASWDLLPAEGGWSAVLRVGRARSEEELALALLDEGVLVQPGWFFDFPAGAQLVVSLLAEEEALARGAAALARVLR